MSDYKTEGVATRQPGKFKRHCQRFWWLHLIIFCASTLVITLILIYVGVPAISQSELNNKAAFFIDEQIVSDPTPNSVTLKVKSRVENTSPFHPVLSAFNASLFLENTVPNIKPFGQITIPQVKSERVTITNVEQVLPILDMEQFIAYNKLVTQSETFRFGLRGRTSLKVSGLPATDVDFNKVPTMKGLNGLKGLDVKNIKISILPKPDGTNMEGTLVIPNPSVMTITLGDMVQDITLVKTGKTIGNATIKNIVLRPGLNEFPMISAADQAAVITAITGDMASNGNVEVVANTRSVTYRGQTLPYFEEAMKATPVTLKLALRAPLEAIGLDLFGSKTGSSSSSVRPSTATAAAAVAP